MPLTFESQTERDEYNANRRLRRKDRTICASCFLRPPEIEGQTLCQVCKEAKRRAYQINKPLVFDLVFNHYGNFCSCCGESNREFLTIDHINLDGGAERRRLKMQGGVGYYKYLIKHNFPTGLQTLCYNCNQASYRYNGICPHIIEREKLMADSYKTPFSNAVEGSSVPTKGSGSGSYDATCIPDTPMRDGGLIPELTFDTHWGEPKNSGPIKDSPFKDAVS